MSSSVAAYAPFVPIFFAQPTWVTMSHEYFEPACLQVANNLPASKAVVQKRPNYPAIFSSGRCTIGVYLTNPPATDNSPHPTAWNTIKKYARQAVSQLGFYEGGTSVNLPSGMQIAVYEQPFIDPRNKCGTVAAFQADRRLTLEECLRQRAIEKGLTPPDPVPATATASNDDWDLSPEELSKQLGDYIRSMRGTSSRFPVSTEVELESSIAQMTTESTSTPSRRPMFSPLPIAWPSQMPSPSPTLSPPTSTPAQSKTKKAKAGRERESSSTRASSAIPTASTGLTDSVGVPLEVNVPRPSWARHRKLTLQKCNKALTQFRVLNQHISSMGDHIAFSVAEMFISSPCAVAVYLTHPDPDGMDTMVRDTWFNIERKARLLVLAAVRDGGSGGYINLLSGVQVVVYDKQLMDPDGRIEQRSDVPLSYALDQVLYAREHGGTTLSWSQPFLHSVVYPTISVEVNAPDPTPTVSFALASPGPNSVFVGLLDSWVSQTPFSYANCRIALAMLRSYRRFRERPTITFSQPVIFVHDNCAVGVFVQNPRPLPEEPINVVNSENHSINDFATSLVDLVVRRFGIGGYVDIPNGVQIAVWEKPWVDPSNICGGIHYVTLQDCLDTLCEYNGRVRRNARALASIGAAGGTAARSLMDAAVSELYAGGSVVASSLLGPNAFQHLEPSTTTDDWSEYDIRTNLAFHLTAPPMPTGTGGSPLIDPRGGGASQHAVQAAGEAEWRNIKTAFQGYFSEIEEGTLSIKMRGGVGQGSDPAARAGSSERLRAAHLGGMVLRGEGDPALRLRGSNERAPLLGDAFSSPKMTSGVVIGEAAWVNENDFLTATGHLTAAPSGRVALVGADTD